MRCQAEQKCIEEDMPARMHRIQANYVRIRELTQALAPALVLRFRRAGRLLPSLT